MSMIQFFKSKGPSGYGYSSTAEEVTQGLSLQGKTYLVTGCNSGLGLETLRVLAMRGARVIATARSLQKAQEACKSVGDLATVPLACELSDPASVKVCVTDVIKAGIHLDGIICNAGIMALPQLELVCGYEKQFFINHMGHFMLVTRLIERLTASGRVVMLSSAAHTRAVRGGIEFANLDGSMGYGAWRFYSQSKFANLLFAKELARRFKGTRRTANAIHPGVVRTNLPRNHGLAQVFFALLGPVLVKNVQQGAATQVYVATHPSLDEVTGQYFSDCNPCASRADAESITTAQRLWEVSEEIMKEVSG